MHSKTGICLSADKQQLFRSLGSGSQWKKKILPDAVWTDVHTNFIGPYFYRISDAFYKNFKETVATF